MGYETPSLTRLEAMTRRRPMLKNGQPRPNSRATVDERLKIVRAAMYFAPKYCKSDGEWALKSRAKFREVKRLIGSARADGSLYNHFCKWFETNQAKWEEMKMAALADWDGYFADEIAQEAELDKKEGGTEGGSKSGATPTVRANHDHGRVIMEPMVVTKIEKHSSDRDSGQRPDAATRASPSEQSAVTTTPGSASGVPQVHHHGPVYHFTAPVSINLKVEPGEVEMLIARFCPGNIAGSAQPQL